MLRKIKLYGALAKFVGHRVLEADVATAAEAVRFLVTNWPELEGHMAKQYYRVHTAGEDLTLDDIDNFMLGMRSYKTEQFLLVSKRGRMISATMAPDTPAPTMITSYFFFGSGLAQARSQPVCWRNASRAMANAEYFFIAVRIPVRCLEACLAYF